MSLNRYNELNYAENILENGFITKYIRYELKILAKYYKYNDMKYKQIEEKLYEFCNKYIPEFDEVKYFRLINHVMNYVRKKTSKLIMIDNIPITKSEFSYIDNIDFQYHHKVFLFCLLVKFKLNKTLFQYGNDKEYVNNLFSHEDKKQREVFLMTQLPKNKFDLSDIIKDLYDAGILDVLDSGKLKLNFLDSIIDDDSPVFINVDTISIDKAGLFYDLILGDKRIKKCSECGIIMRVRAYYHKYCKDCAYKIKLRQNKLNRNKNNERSNI